MQADTTLIDGRAAFQQALRDALATLAEADCREVWLCDRDYADWPLNEPAILDQLTSWAYAHRRLVVVASHFDAVARRHPRWVDWRRRWDHVVQCRVVDAGDEESIPCLLLAPPVVALRLQDAARYRGAVTRELADMVTWRADFDAYLQRSYESFPATTLGL